MSQDKSYKKVSESSPADMYIETHGGEKMPTSSGNKSNEEKSKEAYLIEKLNKTYDWIINHAVISSHYDIEFNDKDVQQHSFTIGDLKTSVTFPSGHSYSSFVLLPLLTLITRKRCLLVGGPGRGKTTSAILMGIIAGYPIQELKRAIQHGQPQMTVSDLLGNPLPSDLMNAKSMEEVKIVWRKWLEMRVKIIDEYNRIPTRTQSALLTVLADNYAEMLDQVYECPDAAWYLTANDDAGGGTYEVIEALKDRIDIVVKALHFNTRYLSELISRVESGSKLEEKVPPEYIFSEQEINDMNKAILKKKISDKIRKRLEFFASHFEFLEIAAEQVEYKTKDTVKLSTLEYSSIANMETGKDKTKDLGSQTKNGLSVRALMTCLTYMKALAYFRGHEEVEFEDVRQIIPFVLHDKLVQNLSSPFFEIPGNQIYKTDKISWIRKMFDLSCAEYDRLELDKKDVLTSIEHDFTVNYLDKINRDEKDDIGPLDADALKKRLQNIEKIMMEWSKVKKIYGHQFDNILRLKSIHQIYTNQLRWVLKKSKEKR